MIQAPWTIDQIRRMNRWQRTRGVIRLDCPNAEEHKFNMGLVAGRNGLFCPFCNYSQQYAPDYMFLPVPKRIQMLTDDDEETPGSK